jgi:hypothetical protein
VRYHRLGPKGPFALMAMLVLVWLVLSGPTRPAQAEGVGGATWTPSESSTRVRESRFLVPGDALTYRTDATWNRAQARGLAGYIDGGLRYTHEVNDRSGRLSATGFWSSNLPDPAYDRDDDDGDRRWEEAEVTAGRYPPEPGIEYSSQIQFSRWHGKREQGACTWAWDRRKGFVEVLSQLSRHLLGEWQSERYTLAYETLAYGRVGTHPPVSTTSARARCSDAVPGANQTGYTVTFARPLGWAEAMGLISMGSAKWTAFEAIGSNSQDDLAWTCGGPVDDEQRLRPCRGLEVEVDGLTAMVGYLDDLAVGQLRDHPDVAVVDELQDQLTGLLAGVGGLGVERPGLTVDDHYWELFLAD